MNKKLLSSLLLLTLAAPGWAKDFTQADLDAMVIQLDKVIPRNQKYKYPVNCTLVDENQVNAYATVRKEGEDLRATMVVYTGLVKASGNDARLVRAVVAHELAHLSLGHLHDLNPAARDLRNLWTRQQEFEADKYGAEALVKGGFQKVDMVDLLLFLDRQHGRNGAWLQGLTGDHADAKARAAELADNPDAFKALVTFDTALAYEDARSHLYAQKLFDYAVHQWPKLTEANINAGKCALLYYYDNLPPGVRTKWWRPDFGPLITNPHAPLSQSVAVTDQDRQAWKNAMAAIEKGVSTNPDSEEAKAMLALGRVLQPDAIKDVVQLGIDWFNAQSTAASNPVTKLRYANNAGVGYYQLGDLQKAYDTIFVAQKGTNTFNSALGENLGLVKVDGRSKEDDTLAANVLFTWLTNTPRASSPRWATVRKTFEEVCTAAGIRPNEIKEKPAFLCQVVTLVTGNKEVGLLLPLRSVKSLLGEPQVDLVFADKWPDLREMHWNNGGFTILTERDNVMRMTSYEPGAYLELKPTDKTSQLVLKVSVGMAKDALFQLLGEDTAVMKDLAKAGKVESWSYFPDLGMGVLIENDKVKAITVTPVQYEEP